MSVGMNGHGMAMAFRCAEALVEMPVGEGEPDWFPRSFRLERAFVQKAVDIRGWREDEASTSSDQGMGDCIIRKNHSL
ncbi:hypothetical protein B0I35DRAFT_447257, partial [Stachybotrys elegans]